MIRMSWMSSLCRWVLFLPGLWPMKAGYCFVSAKKGQKNVIRKFTIISNRYCKVYFIVFNQVACGFVVSPKPLAGPWIAGYKCSLYNEISLLLVVLDESTRFWPQSHKQQVYERLASSSFSSPGLELFRSKERRTGQDREEKQRKQCVYLYSLQQCLGYHTQHYEPDRKTVDYPLMWGRLRFKCSFKSFICVCVCRKPILGRQITLQTFKMHWL